MKKYNLRQEDLAQMLGIQRHHLANIIRDNKIQQYHCWALSAIEERLQQAEQVMNTLTEPTVTDTTKIGYTSQVSSVVHLVMERIKNKLLNIVPNYTCAEWDRVKESRYIESLLMQIPAGVFWIDGRNDERWNIIDGCCRLTALDEFIHGNFKLIGLEYLKNYEDKCFSDLPRGMQRRIAETQCVLYIMRGTMSDEFVQNIASKLGHPLLLNTHKAA